MSGNEISKNQIKINLPNGKTFDLKKLDKLEGKSVSGSVFAKFDKISNGGDGDNIFDFNEIELIKTEIKNLHANDGIVTDDEISELINGPNAAGKDDTKNLLQTLETLEQEYDEDINKSNTPETPSSDVVVASNPKKDKNQPVTKYTVQPGDTPEVIAKKLGLTGQEAKDYAAKLKQHFKDNGFTNKKGWLMVGQEITLLGDQKEKLANLSDYSTDKDVLNTRYAATDHAKSIKAKENKTPKLPDSVIKRATEISNAGGTCNIVHLDDGSLKIVQTAGKGYFEEKNCSSIEILYDKDGNLVSQTDTYKDGTQVIGKMVNGKMTWSYLTPEKDVPSYKKFFSFDNIGLVPDYSIPSDNTRVASRMPERELAIGPKSKRPSLEELEAYLLQETETPGATTNPASKPAEKPAPRMPKTVAELSQFERRQYLSAMNGEEFLPTNLQDIIIQHKLNGKEVLSTKPIYDSNKQIVGFEVEISNRDVKNQVGYGVLKPDAIKSTKIYYNKDGKETPSLANGPQETYKALSKGRVTSDKVATKIKVNVPDHLKENEDAIAYAGSLEKNKASLMATFGITNEEYDNLAALAMGIAEQETHFGESTFTTTDGSNTIPNKMVILKKTLDAIYYADIPVVTDSFYAIAGSMNDKIETYHQKFTDGTKSYGMTQAKIEQFLKEDSAIPAQLRKYGINSGEDIRKDPEKQAIATMIILNNKRITANNDDWQRILDNNNQNISNPDEHITTTDLMALLYNGNSTKIKALKAGKLVLQNADEAAGEVNAPYARCVRVYSKAFFNVNTSDTQEKRADALGVKSQGNNGQIGTVIFMANKYNSNLKNSEEHIKLLETTLKENNINQEDIDKLLLAVKNGEIAFGNGLSETEAKSLTQEDVELLLKKLETLKENTSNLVNPKLIRQEAQKMQDEFKSDYLQSRQVVVTNSDVSSSSIIPALGNGEIVSERLTEKYEIRGLSKVTSGKARTYERSVASYNDKASRGVYTGFAVQADLGVNPYDASGKRISDTNVKLAEAASDVANAMGTGGRCLTGFKTALETAGVEEKGNMIYPRNVISTVKDGQTYMDIALANGYTGTQAEAFADKLKTRLSKQAKIDHDGNLIPGKTIIFKNPKGEKIRYTIKEGDTIAGIVKKYGYTGEQAEVYAKQLTDNLDADLVVDREGNLISGKRIAVHQKGEIIANAKDIYMYFDAHPEKFEEVKYLDLGNGNSREINAADIKNLPAGFIVVFIPGDGFENQSGHVAITNGNGQGYADEVDNLRWDDFVSNGAGNGKGEHGSFKIYKLKEGVI